jgi:hypothetical protein
MSGSVQGTSLRASDYQKRVGNLLAQARSSGLISAVDGVRPAFYERSGVRSSRVRKGDQPREGGRMAADAVVGFVGVALGERWPDAAAAHPRRVGPA